MTIAAPAYLAPAWRYVRNTWVLTYIVYETAPIYAADGVTIVTAGVPLPLAGYTVAGTLSYQSRCVGAPTPSPAGSIAAAGAVVDPINGIVSLTLQPGQTVFPRQSFTAWGDPYRALLIAEPIVTDPNGVVTSVGLQPVFAF